MRERPDVRRMAASMSVFLNVADIERSLAFYRALGFRVDAEHPSRTTGATGWADLSYDGAELGLGHIATNQDPEFRAWVATPLGAGVVVYITVRDVDRIHDAALAAGAFIEVPPEDRSYGRVLTINDPDGYTLTFIREPRRSAPRKKPAAKRRATTKKASRPARKKAPAKRARKAPRRR